MSNSNGRTLYSDVAAEANVPLRQRKACTQGRNGVRKVPRRYHLQAEDIVLLKKEMQEKGCFISPYGSNRVYTYVINSLVLLGVGKAHSFSLVYNKFVELASAEETRNPDGFTLWERFESRASRNLHTGRDPLGKFMQNLEVLQRLGGDHPYALKLAQLGACIDIFKNASQQIMIQLRVGIPDGEPVRPINTNRKRTYTKTVDSIASGIVFDDCSVDEGDAENDD